MGGIHAQAIAEHTLGFLLMFTRNLHLAAARQHEGRWNSQPYRETLRTLSGKTLGILGLGAIGERLAEIAQGFGLRVIGLKRTEARGAFALRGGSAIVSSCLQPLLPGSRAGAGCKPRACSGQRRWHRLRWPLPARRPRRALFNSL